MGIFRSIFSVQVLDPKFLPQFPFRDDALLLHNSIKDYVSKVLNIYYGKIKIILNTQFNSLQVPDKNYIEANISLIP